MKIYIAQSLTHATEEYLTQMDELRLKIEEKHEVLKFFGLGEGLPFQIYEHDINCIKNCDLLLAECSYPATGVGFEFATALNLGKKVIAVAHEGSKLGRLIRGIQNPNFQFATYSNINHVLALIH